jgi:hypothetical protein
LFHFISPFLDKLYLYCTHCGKKIYYEDIAIRVSVSTCAIPTLRVPAPLKYYLDNQSEIVLKGKTVRENLTSASGKALRKKCSVGFGEGQHRVELVFHNMQKLAS